MCYAQEAVANHTYKMASKVEWLPLRIPKTC